MNPEKFNNIASGIQSLLLALAVIIGGVWTLYTFSSLKQVEKAKAELHEMDPHYSLLNKLSPMHRLSTRK